MELSNRVIRKMKDLKEGYDWFENNDCILDNGFSVGKSWLGFIHKEKGTRYIYFNDIENFPKFQELNKWYISELLCNIEELKPYEKQLLNSAITFYAKIADNPGLLLLQ